MTVSLRGRRGLILLAWVISANVLAMSVTGLGTFPDLHADEARFARMALDPNRVSPHGFNRFTASLYPELIASVFGWQSASVTSLRAPGIALNVLAVAMFAVLLWRQGYPLRALWWLVAFGGHLFILAYSRLAWEVTAIQSALVLAALTVIVLRQHDRPDQLSAGWRAVYLGAAIIGTTNHIIFVTLLVAILLGVLATMRSTEDVIVASPAVTLTVVAVGLALLAVAIKSQLDEASFAAAPWVWITAWLGLIPIGVSLTSPTIVHRTQVRLELWLDRLRPAVSVLLRLSVLWFLFSGLALGFVQVLGGDVVHLRLSSRGYPWPMLIAGWALGAFLLGSVLTICWQAVSRPEGRWSFGERWLFATWLFCPAAFAMTGRSQTSMRYYLIPAMVFLVVAATIAARNGELRRVVWLRRGLIVATFIGASLWWPILAAQPDPPRRFLIGNFFETTRHFQSIGPLVEQLRINRRCEVDGSYFLTEPVRFHFDRAPWDCDREVIARLRYCDTCPPPLFVEIEDVVR